MKKFSKFKIINLLFAAISVATFVSYTSAPPGGNTGAQGNYCTGCHGGNALNSSGGSIIATGLPTEYETGGVYNFSLTITHSAANRTKWGFAIEAVDATGMIALGSFSTTNASAAVYGSELGHSNAPVTGASASYTFNNLTWTAPASGTDPVSFYFTGNAANNNSSTSGDFIYAAIQNATVLPVKLIRFNGSAQHDAVNLVWQTATELNNHHFEIQRSSDGKKFEKIGEIASKTTIFNINEYTFSDRNNTQKMAYYRLKQVDNDGTSTLSKAILVKKENTKIVALFPNPTQDEVHLKLPESENIETITVFDNAGRVVKVESTSDFSIQDLNKGIYYLNIKTTDGNVYSEKILKD